MKNELLRLEHVCFRYEDKFPALKDVSITFQRGERIVVLGNNGAGKSTFFLCCNGILHPQSGEIFLKGQKMSGSKEDVRRLRQTVGLVFQEPDTQIIAGTVGSEVSFGPMNLGLDRQEVELRITRSLARMNLEGYENRAPHYLSGGEKKRVSIADILAMEPDMILLDEPTASLDPENVALLERTLEELNEAGITLVVSTHDVDFAYGFARRAVVKPGGDYPGRGDRGSVPGRGSAEEGRTEKAAAVPGGGGARRVRPGSTGRQTAQARGRLCGLCKGAFGQGRRS